MLLLKDILFSSQYLSWLHTSLLLPSGYEFLKGKNYVLTSLTPSIVTLWASLVALVVKNPPVKAGDAGDTASIPGLGRSPGVGNGNPIQYSCLENWSRKWQPNPIFLPGKFHGQRSLVGLQSVGPQSWTRLSALRSFDHSMNLINIWWIEHKICEKK